MKIAIAFALGRGAMVGWKRISLTAKAPAELVAYATIQGADILGYR